MQIDREYEPEINVKDLFFQVLYHWRSCIAAAMVGALLVGGFIYARNLGSWRAEQPASAGTKAAESTGSDVMLANYQESEASYARILEGYEAYRKGSVLMRVDPNQKWVATETWYVRMNGADAANADAADALVIAYVEKAKEGLNSEELKAVYGDMDTRYIQEILETVPARTDSVQAGTAGIANGPSFTYIPVYPRQRDSSLIQGHTFTIRVTGLNERMAEEGLGCFENYIAGYSAGAAQEIGAHQLVLLSRYTAVESDPNLENRQTTISNNIENYQKARGNAQKSGGEIISAAGGKTVPKYALIGFLAGGFLAVCFWAARYVLGGRLHDVSEVSRAYGLPVFGELPRSRAKRPGKGIDALLEKWEFGENRQDRGTVLQGIAALIREKFTEQKVLLTGTIPAEALCPLAEELRKRLSGTVELETQAEFVSNGEAVRASGAADAVLIVEQREVSRQKEVERMAEMLLINQAKVAGCVML